MFEKIISKKPDMFFWNSLQSIFFYKMHNFHVVVLLGMISSIINYIFDLKIAVHAC